MTNPATKKKMRIVICGAGNRVFPKNKATTVFRGWFETIQRSSAFETVGVQDVAESSLERVKKDYPLERIPTFLSLDHALREMSPDAVLVCPIADAHAEAALASLQFGCHVLIEKPLVTSLKDAVRIQKAASRKKLAVGVVQNWRAKSTGLALREAVRSGKIGKVGNIFFRYVRDREQPHLPAYLYEEPFPLLYAMSIHHFDLFRFALGENIHTVEGKGFTPPWSRYRSASAVHLFMKTESGVSISYAGTFSSRNRHVPQESLIVEGSEGSLANESPWGEPPLLFSGVDSKEPEDLTSGASRDTRDQYNQADDWYLEDFRSAIQTGRPPLCSPEDNIWTLAAVEAAVRACETGTLVEIPRMIQEAGEASD